MKAKFVTEILVTDPDFDGDVRLSVFKHENGGMFAIDSSFLDQVEEEDENGDVRIPDIFHQNKLVTLEEL